MPGFYLFRENYNNKPITLIYYTKTKTWYLIRNEIIDIIYNPKLPSSYWCHLKNKYLKKNINIDKLTKNIKIKSKDNKKHLQKVISINNLIKLLDIFEIKSKENLINYINKLTKTQLYLMDLEIETKKIINKYKLLKFTEKELTDIFLKYINENND